MNPECLSRHWQFNLSHMPNPLDTNRIKVVRMFDSVCANAARSPRRVIRSVVGYVLATLGCCSLQLLLVYY